MKPYICLGVRNRPMLESYGLLDSYRHPIAGSDCMIRKCLECAEGFAATNAYEIEDRKSLRTVMEREIREGKYAQEFFDAIDKTYKDAVQDIKTFWKADHVSSSVEELIERYDRFFKIYVATLHPMVVAIYASDLQDLFEAGLRALAGDLTQEEMIDHTSFLLTPTRLTQVQKEEQVLYELQDAFVVAYPKQTREDYDAFIQKEVTKKILAELESTYGWFHMEYIGEPKTVAEYSKILWDRVEDMQKGGIDWKEQVSPKKRLEGIAARQKEFFAKHPDATFFKQLVFAMQEFVIVLDYSKADLVEGIYYARPLLNELGKRVGLGDWIKVRYLLPQELKDLLLSGKTTDSSYIRNRMNHFAMLLEDMKITPYFDEAATELVEKLLQKENTENVREFKGLTAYPGVVRGTACIVTGAADREKFKKGNIMVTRDTTTELTSIIKMASAIVADQGSLLSHTAIVSREFKIPCVVLTQIATKVVKDGDELEVDASSGIVRILS